jgi:subtilisin-like proprotein convertase family protein
MKRIRTGTALRVGLVAAIAVTATALLAIQAPAGTAPGDVLILRNPNAKLIPDEANGGGVLSKIKVRTPGKIRDVDVRLRIDHPRDDELNIYLVSPTGRFVELSTDNGGNGDNYGAGANSCGGALTVFSDEAGARIQDGAAPFLGAFRPQSPLSRLDGRSAKGPWRLQIFDDGAGQTGVLGCWAMKIKFR